MAMEHRWGRRIAVDIGVTLRCRPAGRVRGRLRNISSGGAFVQLPIPLTPHTRVEMVFTSRHGGTAQIHRFETAVSRTTAQGAGLMFLHYDPKALSALLMRLEHQSARRLLTGPRPTITRDSGRPAPQESNANEAK